MIRIVRCLTIGAYLMTTSLEEIKKLKNYAKFQEALDSVKLILEEEELI